MGMMAQRAVALLVFFSSIAWLAVGNTQISPTHRNSLFKVSSCNKNSPGYYVDEDNPCQVVNYCLADGTVVRLQCPPGTSVNQIYASCDAQTEVSECRRRIRKRRQAPQTFNSQFVTLLAPGPPSSSSTFRQRSPQLLPQPFMGQPFMIIAREPQASSPRRTITPRPRPQQLDNRASSATNTLTRPTSGGQSRGRRLMDTQFVSFDDHLIRQAINNDNQGNQASFGAPNRLRADTNSRSPPPRRPSQQQQPSQQQDENRNEKQNLNQHQRQDPFFPPPFFDTNPNFPPRPFFATLPRPQFPLNSPNQFSPNPRTQGNNFIPSPNDNAIVHDVRFPGPPRGQTASSQGTEEARRPSFRPSRPRPSDQSFRQQQQQDEEEQDRQQQLHLQHQEDERIFRRPFQSPVAQNDQFRQLPPPIQLQPPQQDFFQEQFPVAPNPFPPRRPFRPTQTEAPPTTTTTTAAPVSLIPQGEILTQNRFRFGSLRPTIDTQRPQTQFSSLPPTQSQQRRPSQQFQPQPQQFSPEAQQQFNLEPPPPQQFQPDPQQFNTAPQPQQFQTERPQPQQFQTEQLPPQQFQTEQPQSQQFQTEQPQSQQFQTEQPQSQQFQTEQPRSQQFLAERPQQFTPRRPLKFRQETEQLEPESPAVQQEQSPTKPAVASRGRGRFRPSFQDGFELPTTTPSTTPFQTSSPENTGLAPVTDDFGFKLDSTPFVQPTPPSFPTTFSDDIRPRRPSTDFTAGFSDFSEGPATTTEGLLASEQDFEGNIETTTQIIEVTTQVPTTFGVESSDLETKEEPQTTQELTTVTPAPLDTTSTPRPTRVRRPLGPRPRPRGRTTTTTEAPPSALSGGTQEETSTSSSTADGPRRRIRPFARRRRPFQSRNATTESAGISVEEVTTAPPKAGGAAVRPARRRRPLSALMAARRRKPIVGDSDTAASNLHATSPVTEEETLATVTEEQSDIEVTEGSPVQETDQTDEVSATTAAAAEAIETETTTQDGAESKDKSRLRNLFSRRFVLKKQLARPVASR